MRLIDMVSACSLAAGIALVATVALADVPSVYDSESIGPLKALMGEQDLVAVLGAPRKKTAAVMEGATGQWVSSWQWRDAAATMMSETGKPPWIARGVSATHKGWRTKKNISIGSTRAQVEAAYPKGKDDPPDQDRDEYLVGSRYSGMLITFDHDKVTEISIGVFAF